MFEHINRNPVYVKQVQEMVGTKADGIAGPKTLKKLKEYYDCEVICHNGKFVPLGNSEDYVVEHDLSLYELPDGEKPWRYRNGSIDTICLHWGGLNARHCYRVFYNCKGSHVSSHFLIGRDPRDNNRIEVIQCLDTALVSYHAGKFNKYSVGVDICQHPEVRWADKSRKYGYDTHEIENTSHRGPDSMMSLDPELAKVAKAFIQDLRFALELNHKPILKDDEVYGIHTLTYFSVVSHLNVSNKKWDICEPWGKELHWDIYDGEDEDC